jgi:hypothetical protein
LEGSREMPPTFRGFRRIPAFCYCAYMFATLWRFNKNWGHSPPRALNHAATVWTAAGSEAPRRFRASQGAPLFDHLPCVRKRRRRCRFAGAVQDAAQPFAFNRCPSVVKKLF